MNSGIPNTRLSHAAQCDPYMRLRINGSEVHTKSRLWHMGSDCTYTHPTMHCKNWFVLGHN